MTNPLVLLLLVFVVAPLGELYLLIQVGSAIGALPTILLTLATAVAGGVLLRVQGISTALRVNAAMRRGEMPALELMEGLVVLMSGLLLLLPGFVTDLIGLIGLIPPLRRPILRAVLRRVQLRTAQAPAGQTIIEGEFQREEPAHLPNSRGTDGSGTPFK